MDEKIDDILQRYGLLLSRVDAWFSRCIEAKGEEIRCTEGCSECCRALFDITLLDAWFLRKGFGELPAETQNAVREKGEARLAAMRRLWPEFAEPYALNLRPEEEWEELMPDEDETPCLLVSDEGRCLVYENRPMTCRLHGIPLVDASGEIFYDEWCTLNFEGSDPLEMEELRGEFDRLFRDELRLFRELTELLYGTPVNEVDTFIPLATLVDYREFKWREWFEKYRERLLPERSE